MISITVAKCRFSNNKFKCLYLKKEKLFVDFFLHFWNMHDIENFLQKKEQYRSLIITEIIASERDVCLSV